MLIKWLLITTLFCAYNLTSLAQEQFSFISYSVDQGLPQSTVLSIRQDKHHFLWAGCGEGLTRFDGYKFYSYTPQSKDSTSISGITNAFVYSDKQGQIWVAHKNGLSKYNDATNNFSNLITYNPFNQSVAYSYIYGEDDEYLWAGLNCYGIVKINKTTNAIIKITQANGVDLSTCTAWYKGFLENGDIWFTSSFGVGVYHITNNSLQIIESKDAYASIASMSNTEAVCFKDTKAFIINKRNYHTESIPLNFGVTGFRVNEIYKTDKEELMVATLNGIFYFNTIQKKITQHISSFVTGQNTSYVSALSIFTDASKNIWIGTNADGLKKIPFRHKHFKTYTNNFNESTIVKSIYADNNNVYVGYYENGIDVFSRKGIFQKNISIRNFQGSIGDNVFAIQPLDKNTLLIHPSQGIALYKYNIKTASATNYNSQINKELPDKDLKEGRTTDNFYAFIDRNLITSEIIFNVRDHLFALQQSGAVKLLQVFTNEIISCGFTDSDKTNWLGTIKGLYYQNKNKYIAIPLPEQLLVKSINQDNDKNIWVATIKGIFVIDKNKQIIAHYTTSNGLKNQFIYGILKDNEGNMWFSTNKGLGVFNWNKKKFKFYSKDDGLQSDEFNTGAFFKATDGELFFGGIKGTNSFYTNEISDNPNTPAVKITGIKLFDEPYVSSQSYWNINKMILPYTENSLSFEYALPEFTNEHKNSYAYMMEGVDKNWILAEDKRFARYTSLPAGKYTFKVKAANNDGIWSDTPTQIAITIIPPIWKRTWFLILAVCCGIALIAAAVSAIQKRKYKKQMQALEVQHKVQLERERISRDLHDNVGTQLSLISKNIQGMVHSSTNFSEEERQRKLQSAGRSSIEVISSLRETIWALNKEEVSFLEFFDKLKEFAQKQSELNTTTQYEFIDNVQNETLYLGPAEALNLFRICQEAITNALKYANASLLTISIQSTKKLYSITVTDNGIGFDKNNIDTRLHYGLENMRYRAREINCTLLLSTQPDKGTTIIIAKE